MNSGESSETDVKMEGTPVGPELPPGFDAEETKEDATNASTNNSETTSDPSSEPEPEEKKESEKTADEKSEESTEPGMISSALNGAKALTSSMLSTMFGSGGTAEKKHCDNADDELAKAEEFKSQGNEYFGGK